MRPVTTVAEMRAVDEAALAATTTDELVGRAGRRLASHARRMLGRAGGRRVVVVAGKGSNGADGLVAARWLRSWGASVLVLDAGSAPPVLPPSDLVVDAAYGTGFSGAYDPPDPAGAPVLACDIPTGVDGDTGAVERAVLAQETVTFGAWKPGLLLGAGPDHAGKVHVEPIGLDCRRARAWLIEDDDVALVPGRPRQGHKWQSAVLVVAGSPGMLGAARLCATSAMRAGAGYVLLGSPGCAAADLPVGEHVGRTFATPGWEADALPLLERVRAVALGPGLGATPSTTDGVRAVLDAYGGPVVLDADALAGLDLDGLRARRAATVLTPHEGEFSRLFGDVGEDRIAAVRAAAERSGAVVLLKGPTTVIADAGGGVRLSAAGSPRLATAGTGDVLTGLIAAFLARGAPALAAAGVAAHVHGRAAALGPSWGMVAGDLPLLVSRWLSDHAPSGN
jgi:NAD(P)H-hydrate epimerase